MEHCFISHIDKLVLPYLIFFLALFWLLKLSPLVIPQDHSESKDVDFHLLTRKMVPGYMLYFDFFLILHSLWFCHTCPKSGDLELFKAAYLRKMGKK